MKIGLLALARSTFDINYANKKLNQCKKFLELTEHIIIGNGKLLLDDFDASSEIDSLKQENFDFILILQVTFTDSSTVLKVANDFNQPIGIWAFPEPRLGGRLRLNAFCGLNLASHSLGLNDFYFSWIYEDPETISPANFNNVIDQQSVQKRLRAGEFNKVTSKKAKLIKQKISEFKIAKIGDHPKGFDTCKFNQKKLSELCGIKVDEIELNSFLKEARKIKKEGIEPTFKTLHNQLSSLDKVDQGQLEMSIKLKEYLFQLRDRANYHAFALRCWPEMFTEYGGAICGPASIMTENKVPCACEADVYGAVSQLILQEVSQKPVFLTDIVDIDVDDNTGVFWHCGQAPISMCEVNFKPQATIHTNRKMPLLFEFPLKEGVVTIMRISQSLGEQKMVISKGKMVKRGLPYTGTSGVVMFDRGAKQVLDDIISAGLEHHVAIAYGDHVQLLSEVATEMKLPTLYI